MTTSAEITTGFRFKDSTGHIHTVVHIEGEQFTYECKRTGRLRRGYVNGLVKSINQGWTTKVRRTSSK